MSDPLYTIAIEFVAGSFTNVTSDCLHFSYNRELATYDRGLSIGGCELVMQNEERKFTPSNSAGPFYPRIKPNKRLQIQATYSGSTYNLFSGYIDGYTINPILGNRTAYIQASDRVKIMNMQDIDLPLKTNYNIGSLFTDILSSLAVNSADRVIDGVDDVAAFAWFAGRKGTDSINDLLRSTTTSKTDAPITLRTPTSFTRICVAYIAIPNIPKQASVTARKVM